MLDQELKNYGKTEAYPFHMPGHKRNFSGLGEPYDIDITEIAGFDNLHQPESLLLEAMERMQKIYHSEKSYLLVNGSTCGNLAAIFAATAQGDEIIIGRNCHKSVYHAAELRALKVTYTCPTVSKDGYVWETEITEYQRAIEEAPNATAIVVTSPTYEGRVENLEKIVALAHKHCMVVIVDAAHGAHFGCHSFLPTNPVESGADIVVMSLHKTLPALTQTAVLHVPKGSHVRKERIEKYLDMFETSSPSYVLMASICKCIPFLETADSDFEAYEKRLVNFYTKCQKLNHLTLLNCEKRTEKVSMAQIVKSGWDPTKLVIGVGDADMTGYQLMEQLREDYQIELEMASFTYALAMSSVCDTEEGLLRLADALLAIDKKVVVKKKEESHEISLFSIGKKKMELCDAAKEEGKKCPLKEAKGKIAGAMVSIYPPAVPLLVPGEEISLENIRMIEVAMQQGLTITGIDKREQIVVI